MQHENETLQGGSDNRKPGLFASQARRQPWKSASPASAKKGCRALILQFALTFPSASRRPESQ